MQTLVVVPTARSIRNAFLQLKQDKLLDKYITIGEFFEKIIYVPNSKYIDEDTRNILLLEASNFQNFSKLQIERNFFAFMKNSSYIFKFFEELSVEKVDFQTLKNADTYLEYEEHITILEELYKRYCELLKKYHLYDGITKVNEYRFYDGYIKQFDKIKLYIEGILSRFELELLEQVAQITTVVICFETSRFNTKLKNRLEELVKFKFLENHRYEIDLSSKKILLEEKSSLPSKIEVIALQQRILQVGFIQQKIYEFVQEGIAPEDIVVVLPDESFQEFLELFDTKRNFNYAMGRSFKSSELYKKLQVTLEIFNDNSLEKEFALNRIKEDLFEYLADMRSQQITVRILEEVFEHIALYASTKEEKEIFFEEVYKLLKLYPYIKELDLIAILQLFLNRLSKRNFFDIGGGKVTVLGVLETRNVTFDGVIVVDFNDNIVPKRNDKDIYLNSKVRKFASLPTTKEREDLQKDYYYKLFSRAKKVALSYVQNQTTLPSRFLKEFKTQKRSLDSVHLSSILFSSGKDGDCFPKDQEVMYDFTKVNLSATMLESFLVCKRAFYYRYVAKIKPFELPSELPKEWEIGRYIHNGLKELYESNRNYNDAKELKENFQRIIQKLLGNNPLHRFQLSYVIKQLEAFFQNEVERLKEKKIIALEKAITIKYNDLTLYGVIDRIDQGESGLEILDYKTGKLKLYTKNNYEQATSYQLEFYYLLAKELGDIQSVSFYDIFNAKIVQEAFFKEKLAQLKQILTELEELGSFKTIQTEDKKNCEYCAYKIMCGR